MYRSMTMYKQGSRQFTGKDNGQCIKKVKRLCTKKDKGNVQKRSKQFTEKGNVLCTEKDHGPFIENVKGNVQRRSIAMYRKGQWQCTEKAHDNLQERTMDNVQKKDKGNTQKRTRSMYRVFSSGYSIERVCCIRKEFSYTSSPDLNNCEKITF